MCAKYTKPPVDPRRPGALVMPRKPVMGETWTLRDVRPSAGDEYQGMVERTWHDDDGRLWVRFAADGNQAGAADGRDPVFEVWLSYRPGRESRP